MLCIMLSFIIVFLFVSIYSFLFFFFFFSSRRRHTRFDCDWSSDVCSSDLAADEAHRSAERFTLVADPRDGVLKILKDAVAQLQQRLTSRRNPNAPAEDRKSVV